MKADIFPKDFDIVVGGGGPGGWSAAIAASRLGANVLLIERYGFLGGMDSLAFSYQFNIRDACPGIFEKKPLVDGIFQELIRRLVTEKGMIAPEDVWQKKIWKDIRYCVGVPVDPEILKIVLIEMVRDYNVNLLFHSWICDVTLMGDKIESLIIQTKGGRYKVKAKIFIDATGDADISYYSHARTDQDPYPCGSSMNWVLGNVDLQKLKPAFSMETITQLMHKAISRKDLPEPKLSTSPWVKSVTFPVEDVTSGMPFSIGLSFF